MNVLWDAGPATVDEVIAHLAGGPRPAHNTVLTLLRIMEKKGYVRHRREGRAFRFEPLITRARARQRAVRHLLGRFFDRSPVMLVRELLEHDELSEDDIGRVQELLAARAERDGDQAQRPNMNPPTPDARRHVAPE
jgi:predicted transcriptional regulator